MKTATVVISCFVAMMLSVPVHGITTPVYLPMIMGGTAGVVMPTPISTPAPLPTPQPTQDQRPLVIQLVNEYRVANGCPAATTDAALATGAQAWSDRMVATNTVGHSPMGWYAPFGVSDQVAENIASGQSSATEVVEAWKRSPNHNRTLLSCDYHQQGATYRLAVGMYANRWTLALVEALP